MKKGSQFSQTTSSQFRPGQPSYRTFTTFSRTGEHAPHAEPDRYGGFHSDADSTAEIVRQLVQSEMAAMLRVIKTEIETKINSIDEEIQALREQVFKIRDCSDSQKLIHRIQRLEKASSAVAPELLGRERLQQPHPNIRPSEVVLVRDKSERSLSKDRKPIFPKGESSLNLSNILFPDEESQRLMRSRLEFKEEEHSSREPKFDEQMPISKVELPRSFDHEDKPDPVIHELVQEMSTNKNKFLRNKSLKAAGTQPQPTAVAGTPALPIGQDANLTIPEEEQEESLLQSARKRK